jgi:hypothetical protein
MNPADLTPDDRKQLEFHKRRWADEYLFRTSPADRPTVQDIVSALYRKINFEPPRHFLWYDSPLGGVWAAGLLAEPHDWLLESVLKNMQQTRAGVSKIEEIRGQIQKQMDVSSWQEAIASAGRMHQSSTHVRVGAMAVRKDIKGGFYDRIGSGADEDRDAPAPAYWMQLGLAVQEASYTFYGSPLGELAGKQAERDGASMFGTVLSSSVSRVFPLVLLVAAETRAYVAGRDPGSPTSDLCKLFQSCGWWWAFENAVILVDRPAAMVRDELGRAHNGSGAAISFRDGWGVYAWHGALVDKALLLEPENADPKQIKKIADPAFRKFVLDRFGQQRFAAATAKKKATGKPSKILSVELPRDPGQRIAALRKYTPQLPLFDRYLAGERQQAWAELAALGPRVREDPFAADALAVAGETMTRVAANIDTVIARLHGIGYEFRTQAVEAEHRQAAMERALAMEIPQSSRHTAMLGMVDKLRGMLGEALAANRSAPRDTAVRAHVAPSADTWKLLRRLEKKAGVLPLSLRAFYEIVGSVDLLGFHPSLAPKPGENRGPCPDPLVVFAPEDVLQDIEASDEYEDDDGRHVIIAPDELHKAETSGGSPYEIAVPCLDADGVLETSGMNSRSSPIYASASSGVDFQVTRAAKSAFRGSSTN